VGHAFGGLATRPDHTHKARPVEDGINVSKSDDPKLVLAPLDRGGIRASACTRRDGQVMGAASTASGS